MILINADSQMLPLHFWYARVNGPRYGRLLCLKVETKLVSCRYSKYHRRRFDFRNRFDVGIKSITLQDFPEASSHWPWHRGL
mgnify:CR=1 FL=1